MNLLQTALKEVQRTDPSSVVFPDLHPGKYQNVVCVANNEILRAWGSLQELRKRLRDNPEDKSLKAQKEITQLHLIEALKECVPPSEGNQVIGIASDGQIFWGKYDVYSSNHFNELLKTGTAFFIH